MKSRYFQAVRKGTFAGLPAGALVAWLEIYIQILFPENGIEWWSDNQYAKVSVAYLSDSELPDAREIHHFACYVRTGNESPIIEVNIVPKEGTARCLTTIKLFESREVCWKMCDAIEEALESIFTWNEIPLIVEMLAKLPRSHRWSLASSLAEPVICLKTPIDFSVRTQGGTLIDATSFEDVPPAAVAHAVNAVEQDWRRLLAACGVDHQVVEALAP